MQELLINRYHLVQDINNIFKKYHISEEISIKDILLSKNELIDSFTEGDKFSNIIINFIWPSILKEEVYHYTSKEAAEAILNTNIFRLSNIAKRYGQEEIEIFCKNHNLTYPLEKNVNGVHNYKNEIMPNTFYASFTSAKNSDINDKYLWNQFSSPNGVRLKFRIQANHSNFRKIKYEKEKGIALELYNDILLLIKNKYKRLFILKGLSRFASFYLPKKYLEEKELRLLFRTWDNDNTTKYIVGDKNVIENTYLEIPLNQHNFTNYHIEVKEIQTVDTLNLTNEKYKNIIVSR